jgi:tetratricopeptide (TPR) repeat protein
MIDHNNNLYLIVAYTIAISFTIITVLTIVYIFFANKLKTKGFELSSKWKNTLFIKIILEIIIIGFFIFNSGFSSNRSETVVVEGDMPREVYSLYNKAFENYGKGNKKASLKNFSDAIKLQPDNYLLYLNRSVIYLGESKNSEALVDLNTGLNLYEKMSDQRKRRERVLKLLIVNQLIALYNFDNKFEKVLETYNENKSLIHDINDINLRIYTNLGNSYLNQSKWTSAIEAFKNVQVLSQILNNQELEIKAVNNISKGLFWIKNKQTESYEYVLKSLELLKIYNIDRHLKAEMYAHVYNDKGLIEEKLFDMKILKISLDSIMKNYNEGIKILLPHEERTESEYLTLSYLYSGKANILRRKKEISDSKFYYKKALNRFIKRNSYEGISKQLIGFCRILRNSNSKKDLYNAYACVKLAINLNTHKNPLEKQEDELILLSISSKLTKSETNTIDSNINIYLQSATGIDKNVWEQFKI